VHQVITSSPSSSFSPLSKIGGKENAKKFRGSGRLPLDFRKTGEKVTV